MSSSDSDSNSINPYHPPAEVSPSDAAVADALGWSPSLEAIEFAGAVGPADREVYLSHEGDLGCAFPIWSIIFVGLVGVILVGVGGIRMAPTALALATLLAIGLMVSTRSYRRLLFQSANPDWRRPVRGRFTGESIEITRDGVTTQSHYDAVGQMTAHSDLIVVPWIVPEGAVLILTPAMVAGLDDWARLTGLVHRWSLRRQSDLPPPSQSDVVRSLRNSKRPASVTPPPGATKFAGPVQLSDVESLPRRYRRVGRPLRARIIRIVVLISVVGLIFEFIVQVMPFAEFWVLLLAAYLIAGAARWVAFLFRNRSPGGRQGFHFQSGFVTEDAVTLDLGSVIHRLPWEHADVIHQSAETVVIAPKPTDLGTPPLRIFLKRSMFADDEGWQTLLARCGQLG